MCIRHSNGLQIQQLSTSNTYLKRALEEDTVARRRTGQGIPGARAGYSLTTQRSKVMKPSVMDVLTKLKERVLTV